MFLAPSLGNLRNYFWCRNCGTFFQLSDVNIIKLFCVYCCRMFCCIAMVCNNNTRWIGCHNLMLRFPVSFLPRGFPCCCYYYQPQASTCHCLLEMAAQFAKQTARASYSMQAGVLSGHSTPALYLHCHTTVHRHTASQTHTHTHCFTNTHILLHECTHAASQILHRCSKCFVAPCATKLASF